MFDEPSKKKKTTDEQKTLASRVTLPRRPRGLLESADESGTAKSPPLLLQHFFDGAVDLDKELSARFANMPVLSVIRVRQFNGRVRSGAALMSTQDGAAALLVEINGETRDISFTFTLSGMLALRFNLFQLSDMDRAGWYEPMKRESSEIAFLWNQARWENDYLICTAHRHFTNIFAFSKFHVEASARLTTEVSRKFLGWVAEYW